MDHSPSVTRWIQGVAVGDPKAAEILWSRYYPRLVQYAHRRLGALPRRVADEEDVALSAFKSFCHAARQGRFPHLQGRDDLWRLLLKMTARKAADLVRYHVPRGRVRGESALGGRDRGSSEPDLDQVIGESPTPEFAAQVADQCRYLLDLLGDESLRALAIARMEGHTNEEIARGLGCSVRTIERRLYLIRRKWEAADGAA